MWLRTEKVYWNVLNKERTGLVISGSIGREAVEPCCRAAGRRREKVQKKCRRNCG